MRILIQCSLVRRDPLDDSPDLAALHQVFARLDEGPLLKALTHARGRGRLPRHLLGVLAGRHSPR